MKTFQQAIAFLLLIVIQVLWCGIMATNTPTPVDPTKKPTPDDNIGTINQQVSRVQSGLPEKLQDGSRDFHNGEMVHVTNGGKGKLSLKDGTVLILFNETKISGVNTSISPPETDLFLQSQGFLGYVPEGGDTTVSLPNGAQITILGTNFLILYEENSKTAIVGNFDGTVHFTPFGGAEQNLQINHYVEIFGDGSISVPKSIPFSPEQFEQVIDKVDTPWIGVNSLVDSKTEGSTEGPTEVSSGGNWIAFNSRMSGNSDIYLIDINGNNLTQLTTSRGNELYPSWSPDGKHIVYQTDEDGDQDIAVIDITTKRVVIITSNSCNDWGPNWSPADGWITFYSDCDGVRNIYKMRVDGSDRIQLTFTSDSDSKFPSWSHDGSKITFSSNRSGKYRIYVMDADGGNIMEMSRGCVSYYSPDDKQILYGVYCDDTDDIFLMNSDGSNSSPLTDGYEIKNASWSPDGTRILVPFSKTTIDGPYAIYIMSLDSPKKSNWTLLTSYDINGKSPVWQP